ncbi:Exosome complex component csl4 [Mycena kentingensis (nom. inval.)]|nr:Exosome complex component csl4 [Mycena kentingensis (nom. inval.)]
MSILLPGQPVPLPPSAPIPQFGVGIYSKDGQLRASVVGIPQQDGSVSNLKWSNLVSDDAADVVLGTVTRLSPLQVSRSRDASALRLRVQATISITVVDGVPLPPGEEFTGVIRTQDVRATDKDRVRIADSFRGGDVVRGEVISLGDSRSYYITTAKNTLGVVFGVSESGRTLVPASWAEMVDPVSGKSERRKVAKPDDA